MPHPDDNDSSDQDGLDIQTYLNSLPPSAQPHLELKLDSGHDGVEKDLAKIAHHMVDWQEKLVTHLELTHVDVKDILKIHPNNPVLQRYIATYRTIYAMNLHSYNVHNTYFLCCMQKRSTEEVAE